MSALRVAEQQNFVWRNGITRREVDKPSRHPDLVAAKNAGVALDPFHERAGFPLLGSAALAKASGAQAGPQFIDGLGRRRKIVRGVVIGVERQIDVDALETRDDTGEGAHMLAKSCERLPRRNSPIAAACHQQLAAAGKLDRDRRALRVAQFFPATHRALWAGRQRNASRLLNPKDPG